MHEVLGEKPALAEILMILSFSLSASIGLFVFTRTEWSVSAFWKTALLFLLIFDVLAGFIANLTRSTNDYYQARPKLRLVFIAIHIQPLLFSLLLSGYVYVCLVVWAYTTATALLVNAMNGHPAQRVLAASLVTMGLVGLFLFSAPLPTLLSAALAFYHLKVTYSFSVDHYAVI